MRYYEPLTRFLERRREPEIALSFRDLETILNRSLPASARKHQAWWANTQSHSHAESWLRPEWKTSRVDIAAERVVFERTGKRPSGAGDAGRLSPTSPRSKRPFNFSPAAQRLLDDYASVMNGDMQQAVARAVHEAAMARRARLIDQIAAAAPRASDNSVDLIREDRDAK